MYRLILSCSRHHSARSCAVLYRRFTSPPNTCTPPPKGHPLLEHARQYLAQRKQQEALEAYHQILEEEPDNATAHANLAVLLQYVDLDQSETHFARAVELGADEDPDFAGQYAGFLIYEKENKELAEVYFRKATAHPSCSGVIHYFYGKFLLELNRFEEAKLCFDRALELPSTYVQLRLLCTYAAMAEDHLLNSELAERLFLQALEIDKEDVETNVRYGTLLHKTKKDTAGAIVYFGRALHQNGSVATPMLADCLSESMTKEEAYSQFEKIVQQNDGNSPVILAYHCYAMHLLQKCKDLVGAEIFFQKCCDIPVGDSKIIPQMYGQIVLNYAIFCALETRHVDRAKALLDYAKSACPEIPDQIIEQANGYIQKTTNERQAELNKLF